MADTWASCFVLEAHSVSDRRNIKPYFVPVTLFDPGFDLVRLEE